MTNRDRLLMMTASGIVRDIRPECMNAAEILGRVTEALATRDAEIERLTALVQLALRGLHNDFEPDNQSAIYNRIKAALNQQPSGSRCMLCGAITETTCTPEHPARGCQQDASSSLGKGPK